MRLSTYLLLGAITLGAQCLAQPLSEDDQNKIFSRLENPLIGECQKYFEFDAFTQMLINGDLPAETEPGHAKMAAQFVDYLKSYELSVRSNNPPESVVIRCNAIAQAITEAALMKAQFTLNASAAIAKGLGEALNELGKGFGTGIGEGLKDMNPPK